MELGCVFIAKMAKHFFYLHRQSEYDHYEKCVGLENVISPDLIPLLKAIRAQIVENMGSSYDLNMNQQNLLLSISTTTGGAEFINNDSSNGVRVHFSCSGGKSHYEVSKIDIRRDTDERYCDAYFIDPNISEAGSLLVRNRIDTSHLDRIYLSIGQIHNIESVDVSFPIGAMTSIVGVSEGGKTTLLLKCLVPAVSAILEGQALPSHIKCISGIEPIKRVVTIDIRALTTAVHSTVGEYLGVFEELCSIFPKLTDSDKILSGLNIREILELSVDEAIKFFDEIPSLKERMKLLSELDLGYLKLSAPTIQLKGKELFGVKLAAEIGKSQEGTLIVCDEPLFMLEHSYVGKVLRFLDSLVRNGGTVVVIEHHFDFVGNADYVIEMGALTRVFGGEVIAEGTPAEICANKDSLVGPYLRKYADKYGIDLKE